MSFSKTLKAELCDIRSAVCCRKAELYGILLFSKCFSQNEITAVTESEALCSHITAVLKKDFGIFVTPITVGQKRKSFKLTLGPDESNLLFNEFSDGNILNRNITEKECCKNAFLRGMFLSCGQASDPTKEYRIDLRIKNPDTAYAVFDILYKRELSPKLTLKGNTNYIYFRKSESIEDFLTIISATPATLELMDIKIIKGVRNEINRKNNAEDANTSKSIEASIAQRRAIELLIKKGKFEMLGDDLKEIALLRTANPEASLSELCKLCSTSISRSGINHRISRIMELAKKYEEEDL